VGSKRSHQVPPDARTARPAASPIFPRRRAAPHYPLADTMAPLDPHIIIPVRKQMVPGLRLHWIGRSSASFLLSQLSSSIHEDPWLHSGYTPRRKQDPLRVRRPHPPTRLPCSRLVNAGASQGSLRIHSTARDRSHARPSILRHKQHLPAIRRKTVLPIRPSSRT